MRKKSIHKNKTDRRKSNRRKTNRRKSNRKKTNHKKTNRKYKTNRKETKHKRRTIQRGGDLDTSQMAKMIYDKIHEKENISLLVAPKLGYFIKNILGPDGSRKVNQSKNEALTDRILEYFRRQEDVDRKLLVPFYFILRQQIPEPKTNVDVFGNASYGYFHEQEIPKIRGLLDDNGFSETYGSDEEAFKGYLDNFFGMKENEGEYDPDFKEFIKKIYGYLVVKEEGFGSPSDPNALQDGKILTMPEKSQAVKDFKSSEETGTGSAKAFELSYPEMAGFLLEEMEEKEKQLLHAAKFGQQLLQRTEQLQEENDKFQEENDKIQGEKDEVKKSLVKLMLELYDKVLKLNIADLIMKNMKNEEDILEFIDKQDLNLNDLVGFCEYYMNGILDWYEKSYRDAILKEIIIHINKNFRDLGLVLDDEDYENPDIDDIFRQIKGWVEEARILAEEASEERDLAEENAQEKDVDIDNLKKMNESLTASLETESEKVELANGELDRIKGDHDGEIMDYKGRLKEILVSVNSLADVIGTEKGVQTGDIVHILTNMEEKVNTLIVERVKEETIKQLGEIMDEKYELEESVNGLTESFESEKRARINAEHKASRLMGVIEESNKKNNVLRQMIKRKDSEREAIREENSELISQNKKLSTDLAEKVDCIEKTRQALKDKTGLDDDDLE